MLATTRRLLRGAPTTTGLPARRYIFQQFKSAHEDVYKRQLEEYAKRLHEYEASTSWFKGSPPEKPQASSFLQWWPGYDFAWEVEYVAKVQKWHVRDIAAKQARAQQEWKEAMDKGWDKTKEDIREHGFVHHRSEERRGKPYEYQDMKMDATEAVGTPVMMTGYVMSFAFVFRLIGLAISALLVYEYDSKYRAVELTTEQKEELRSVIVNLELPDLEEEKPWVPHLWRAVPGYRRVFGHDGSLLEGGPEHNFPPWKQASALEKQDVADIYLGHLLDIFHKLSDGKRYITPERWRELEKQKASAAGVDKPTEATLAVCGAVFSQGGRGMRVGIHPAATTAQDAESPSSLPATSAETYGGLSFRTFATLCTLLASSTQGDVRSQARLVFFLVDEDADGVISRAELKSFVATCLDANLLRPIAFHQRVVALLAQLQAASLGTSVALGIRGNPGYSPPQWCLDQAESLTDDIMASADTNHDGVLDEAEFSKTVAPLIYEEMRAQGFQPPRVTDGGKIDDWQGGTECDFNQLLRKCQLDDVGSHHRRYRRRVWNKPGEGNWNP